MSLSGYRIRDDSVFSAEQLISQSAGIIIGKK
jgi:hypothetical protein